MLIFNNYSNISWLGCLVQSGASLTANWGVTGSNPGAATFFSWDLVMKKISTTIFTLPLIQEGQLSVTGLPRNSVARLTDSTLNDLKFVQGP